LAIRLIKQAFPESTVDWQRVNYSHRDGSRLQLNVKETTTGTHIASVKQSDMEPDNLGEGAYELQRELQRFKQEVAAED
tara:strand:+ start:461 stop:697 length:237 start_codon:yes stop_codon:yes gene_type:complete